MSAILDEESENAATDAANISGAVRMEAEMARKEAWTLDNFVASLRQRSRDAIAAGMPRYSDALDAFADNIEAAIKIERAGVSAMRDALEKSEKKAKRMREALRQISEELWAAIDPGCHGDCCSKKRAIAKVADDALAETEGGAE